MDEYLQKIDMKQIRKMLPAKIDTELGDDLFIVRINYDEAYLQKVHSFLEYPCRTDVYLAFFCNKGTIDLEVNLRTFSLTEHTMFISTPGNIIKAKSSPDEKSHGLEILLLAISPSFLSNISMEVSKSLGNLISFLSDPVIHLNDEAIDMCEGYINLSKKLIDSDCTNKREAVGALISSLFYYFVSLVTKRDQDKKPVQMKNTSVRVTLLLERFIKLVTEYHNSERNMAFYASNLGLTPKYLSKLIKQASGRSAPEWIDSFVILEAKNMLKYTDYSIKEIVYKLHFPNPSVFYKFFKAHTGMTPSQYRNM
jgi:AraC-like DNA-binding protein